MRISQLSIVLWISHKLISDFLDLERAQSSTKVNVGHYFLNC